MYRKIICVILISLIISPSYGISLDGKFDDWKGLPNERDTKNDEIPSKDLRKIWWYPDSENDKLFFSLKRKSIYQDIYFAGRKFSYKTNWFVMMSIKVDRKVYHVYIFHRVRSRKVRVTIRNQYGRMLWRKRGYYGGRGSKSNRIEFSLPIDLMVDKVYSGYELEYYIESRMDFFPNYGYNTISSISTSPILLAIIVVCFVAFQWHSGKEKTW